MRRGCIPGSAGTRHIHALDELNSGRRFLGIFWVEIGRLAKEATPHFCLGVPYFYHMSR